MELPLFRLKLSIFIQHSNLTKFDKKRQIFNKIHHYSIKFDKIRLKTSDSRVFIKFY